MNIDKITARGRWNDPVFQGSVESVLLKLVQGSPELAGIDIAGIAIGNSGPIKSLWSANLYRAKLTAVDLSFAELACSLNESEFDRVMFKGAQLDRCLVRKAIIKDCDFTKAKLVVNCDDSVFERCQFTGATFAGGKAGSEYGGRRVKFVECDFTGTAFKSVELRATQFVNCIFKGAEFVECDLRGTKVTGDSIPTTAQFQKMDVPSWAAESN